MPDAINLVLLVAGDDDLDEPPDVDEPDTPDIEDPIDEVDIVEDETGDIDEAGDLDEPEDGGEGEPEEGEEESGESEEENEGSETEDDDETEEAEQTAQGEAGVNAFDQDFDDEGYLTVSGEFLVLLDDDASDLLNLDGIIVEEAYALNSLDASLYRISVDEDDDVSEIAIALADAAGDAVVDYNHLYEPESSTAGVVTPCPPLECAIPLGWPNDTPSAVRIGLIDTGIDETHPALANANIHVEDFVQHGQAGSNGHGTAIASILVGDDGEIFQGLAVGAELYVASVFTAAPSGELVATAESLVRAIDWSLSEGAGALNLSLAGPPNELLEFAIARTVERGVPIVAAVGNAGPAAPPLYPAAYPAVYAVTAIGPDLMVYRRANRGAHVDFTAPGVDVLAAAAGGGYRSYTGTSFATPFVSVIVAATKDRSGAHDPRPLLRRQAIDLGREGYDQTFGYGLINIE